MKMIANDVGQKTQYDNLNLKKESQSKIRQNPPK